MLMIKTCKICGKQYESYQPRSLTCSWACHEENNRRYALERAKREQAARKTAEWKRPTPCRICGELFVPTMPTNTVCRNPECRREDNRRRMRERQDERTRQMLQVQALERGDSGEIPPLEDWRSGRICPYCGERFIPIAYANRVCHKKECQRERDRANAKAAYQRMKQNRQAQAEGKPMPEPSPDPKPKPKRKRRGPKPGSLEWCVKEADSRGMSYGQFVAAMDAGEIDGKGAKR